MKVGGSVVEWWRNISDGCGGVEGSGTMDDGRVGIVLLWKTGCRLGGDGSCWEERWLVSSMTQLMWSRDQQDLVEKIVKELRIEWLSYAGSEKWTRDIREDRRSEPVVVEKVRSTTKMTLTAVRNGLVITESPYRAWRITRSVVANRWNELDEWSKVQKVD